MIQNVIFPFIGGLGLFIYGIHLMGEGLQKATGERMRNVLKALTANPVMGMSVGAGITSIVQSSSATTVMVVGFVNAGLMTLVQSIGVIFGANIGTTITAQIIAFKLTNYALPIIGIGFGFYFFSKRRFWKSLGEFLFGFGIIFLGLLFMTQAVKPFGQNEMIRQAIINFSYNPFLGILIGALVTALVQSSSVTTGMVLALVSAGLLDLRGAIPIIFGSNIGTCVTALIASIGTSISARRTAIAHALFNVMGVVIFLPFLGLFTRLISHVGFTQMRQVANAHTIFNVVNALIFLPFAATYAKIVTKLVPGGKEEEIELGPKYLEKHLLNTPLIALDASIKEVVRMARLAKEMVNDSMKGFFQEDTRLLAKIAKKESAMDDLQKAITNYLVELTTRELSEEESEKIPSLLHTVNDLERIGDHSENLVELSERKIDERLPFSDSAIRELHQVSEEINGMISDAIKALTTNSPDDAKLVIDREDVINNLTLKLRNNHIQRLNEGKCNVLSGIIFLDMISNFEKIGDHLTNVGQAVRGHLQWHTRRHPIGLDRQNKEV